MCRSTQFLCRPSARTFGKIVFDDQVGFICRHGHVERGHRIPLRLAGGPRAIVGRHCVLPGYGLERRGGRGRCSGGSLQHNRHGGRGPRRRSETVRLPGPEPLEMRAAPCRSEATGGEERGGESLATERLRYAGLFFLFFFSFCFLFETRRARKKKSVVGKLVLGRRGRRLRAVAGQSNTPCSN